MGKPNDPTPTAEEMRRRGWPVLSLCANDPGVPNADCREALTFFKGKGRVTVRMKGDDSLEWRHFELTDRLWRCIARFLAGLEGRWLVDPRADPVGVSSVLEPWQVCVLTMCWTRTEEDEQAKHGADLAELPEPWLADAFAFYSGEEAGEASFFEDFLAVRAEAVREGRPMRDFVRERFLSESASPLLAALRHYGRRQIGPRR